MLEEVLNKCFHLQPDSEDSQGAGHDLPHGKVGVSREHFLNSSSKATQLWIVVVVYCLGIGITEEQNNRIEGPVQSISLIKKLNRKF